MTAPSARPPSVDALARSIADVGLPHPLLVEAARAAIAAGDAASARARAEQRARSLLRPVLNATGVLLHTNLGRAPVAHAQAAGYTNLELDLRSGRRGSRSDHVARLWADLCGAEAALVVNNGAAAVLLVLAALAPGQGVAVSRSELVEIGGGFRVPEVMAQSGARLVEVGTTNRTRRSDFERAVATHGEDLAVLLKVHQSNYRIVGFTETVEVGELAGLGPPVVADIGSGLLDAACPWLPGGPPPWLAGEPAARQTLAAGADLVTFSGDKLAGGPQAGVIAGRAELVSRCAAHPLARALRPGGLVLAALQSLALTYLERRGGDIPFWRMATVDAAELRSRAFAVVASAARGRVVDLASVPGGGTLPGVVIASAGVSLGGDRLAELRAWRRPVIGRVEEGRTLLDLRSVDPGDDSELASALSALALRTKPQA
ncbi:MAG: L-seryl-tRNA(Sec) selenium transferase [Acidimicrobiia bacterium]|nr:L-seryl-tRNA(Sec) selenium transferase [Acidimicrobiia bacterium]